MVRCHIMGPGAGEVQRQFVPLLCNDYINYDEIHEDTLVELTDLVVQTEL